MQIVLLTHERELERPTNTGRLALDVCSEDASVSLRRLVWHRTEPDATLLALLAQSRTGVLYPDSEVQIGGSQTASLGIAECDVFILLDGTWQEARKMYNRSPYLHEVPRVDLKVGGVSRFTLRRNQRAGCLCTAETVIEILRAKGRAQASESLGARFNRFLAESP